MNGFAPAPTAGAQRAVEHAERMLSTEGIWFDSWGNDLRDNNLDGVVDDRGEQGFADGVHYGRSYWADVCYVPYLEVNQCPGLLRRRVQVQYKVCIDVPLESYRAAGLPVPHIRRIPGLAAWFRRQREWQTWRAPNLPDPLLPGDFVAVMNREHQHSGIVQDVAFGLLSNVINLPGPSVMRRFYLYDPNAFNDIISIPTWVWRSFLGFDFVARPRV